MLIVLTINKTLPENEDFRKRDASFWQHDPLRQNQIMNDKTTKTFGQKDAYKLEKFLPSFIHFAI